MHYTRIRSHNILISFLRSLIINICLSFPDGKSRKDHNDLMRHYIQVEPLNGEISILDVTLIIFCTLLMCLCELVELGLWFIFNSWFVLGVGLPLQSLLPNISTCSKEIDPLFLKHLKVRPEYNINTSLFCKHDGGDPQHSTVLS